MEIIQNYDGSMVYGFKKPAGNHGSLVGMMV